MTYLIGIGGGSGSGKTSFINALRNRFPAQQVCIISQDNYYHPIEKQVIDEKGIHNFDLPHSIDHQTFLQDLERLKNGQSITIEEYTFNNEDATPQKITIYPAPIIVTEGIFLYYEKAVRTILDLKIFIDAKDTLKIIRRIKRDQIERNYPLDDVLYRYEKHVTPAYEQFLAPLIHEMDMIILNNHSFVSSLEVLSGFIRDSLNKMPPAG